MAVSVDNDEFKADVIALEDIKASIDIDNEKGNTGPNYTPEELKNVIRKLDWHLMPLCFLMYTFSVLDVSIDSSPLTPVTFDEEKAQSTDFSRG